MRPTIEKISAVTLRVVNMTASVRFYRDVLDMELLYGGEGTGFSSLRARDTQSAILNLEQGKPVTRWGRLIFYVTDVDALWNHLKDGDLIPRFHGMPRGENAISTCPIRTATSCRLPGRSVDSERVTRVMRSPRQLHYSSGGGQAASLKVGSTVILHSSSNHSNCNAVDE